MAVKVAAVFKSTPKISAQPVPVYYDTFTSFVFWL